MTTLTADRLFNLCSTFPCADLPQWDEFPSIPLYMDQVLILLNSYLYPDSGDSGDDRTLTPSMINNYIKSRIFPASVKKKYYRHHLAALIMICILKETVSISDIPKILPGLGTVEGIRADYENFQAIFRRTGEEFRASISKVFREHPPEDSDPDRIILRLAIIGNLCKSLTDSAVAIKKADEAAAGD